MSENKSSGREARDGDSIRLVVRTDPTILARLNAVMSGRRYRHPHGHLMAGTPVMKNLRDR